MESNKKVKEAMSLFYSFLVISYLFWQNQTA